MLLVNIYQNIFLFLVGPWDFLKLHFLTFESKDVVKSQLKYLIECYKHRVNNAHLLMKPINLLVDFVHIHVIWSRIHSENSDRQREK